MKNYSCLRAPLAALAFSVLLPACALPPRDAWRVIRHDGFLTYLSIEFGKQPPPPKLSTSAGSSSVARHSPPSVTVPWRSSPNRYWSTNPASPVVGPPRISPPIRPVAATVPKPILRTLPPKAADIKPPTATKAPEKTASSPPATPAASKPELQAKPKPPEPKVVAVPQAPPTAPAKQSPPAPSPAPPSTPSVSAAARIDDLPYGDVIAGRPGFVHSPYALKSQIVDVTGLRPGQEVKCPFTGKLFRVPPGEQAAAQPADEKK